MSNKKKKSSPKAVEKRKNEFVVVAANINRYRYFDMRSNKPMCYKKPDGSGEMVIQEIEELKVQANTKAKESISYFSPNNVGIMLSIANKSLQRSQKILAEIIIPNITESSKKNGKEEIENNSRVIYDYIEEMQSSIVFGYTALESFCNLSIPEEYKLAEKNNKGITEIYDKDAIERWTSLSKKISVILPEIYQTIPINQKGIWSKFKEFEELRNEIIHQKSVTSVGLYKKYFRKNIVSLCEIPQDIIKFFFEERQEKQKTNILWPWMINIKNDLPISYDFKSDDFEVIGNLYEGKK